MDVSNLGRYWSRFRILYDERYRTNILKIVKLTTPISFWFLWLFLTIALTKLAHATEFDWACAAVYPCDENGQLLVEFADPKSNCFDYYYTICERDQATKEVEICDEQLDRLARANKRGQRAMRRLKQKLKARMPRKSSSKK